MKASWSDNHFWEPQNIIFLSKGTDTVLHCNLQRKDKKQIVKEILNASLILIIAFESKETFTICTLVPGFAQNLTDNCWNTFSSILDDLEQK